MNKNIKKINVGVVGVGHLGEHHVKHLQSIESFNILDFTILMEKRLSLFQQNIGLTTTKILINY